MYARTTLVNRLKCRATELALNVGNVMESRHSGIISDTEASSLLADLVKANKDLVLQEQEDPMIKELMRGVRIALLPFTDEPFHAR